MSAKALAVRSVAIPVDVEAPSDLELVAQAKKGDPDAFSVLVERHQHLVFNLAYRFMRDNSLAEDMSQEAFLKAFRMLRGFRGDCNFSTWMYRVTANVCLTELTRRKKRREVDLEKMGTDGNSCISPFFPAPASSPDRFDMPDLIRRCVTKLPERYAAIITLYYLKEIPYDEIAGVMRIPMGTLKTWMHRARHHLRKIVEKELRCHGSS